MDDFCPIPIRAEQTPGFDNTNEAPSVDGVMFRLSSPNSLEAGSEVKLRGLELDLRWLDDRSIVDGREPRVHIYVSDQDYISDATIQSNPSAWTRIVDAPLIFPRTRSDVLVDRDTYPEIGLVPPHALSEVITFTAGQVRSFYVRVFPLDRVELQNQVSAFWERDETAQEGPHLQVHTGNAVAESSTDVNQFGTVIQDGLPPLISAKFLYELSSDNNMNPTLVNPCPSAGWSIITLNFEEFVSASQSTRLTADVDMLRNVEQAALDALSDVLNDDKVLRAEVSRSALSLSQISSLLRACLGRGVDSDSCQSLLLTVKFNFHGTETQANRIISRLYQSATLRVSKAISSNVPSSTTYNIGYSFVQTPLSISFTLPSNIEDTTSLILNDVQLEFLESQVVKFLSPFVEVDNTGLVLEWRIKESQRRRTRRKLGQQQQQHHHHHEGLRHLIQTSQTSNDPNEIVWLVSGILVGAQVEQQRVIGDFNFFSRAIQDGLNENPGVLIDSLYYESQLPEASNLVADNQYAWFTDLQNISGTTGVTEGIGGESSGESIVGYFVVALAVVGFTVLVALVIYCSRQRKKQVELRAQREREKLQREREGNGGDGNAGTDDEDDDSDYRHAALMARKRINRVEAMEDAAQDNNYLDYNFGSGNAGDDDDNGNDEYGQRNIPTSITSRIRASNEEENDQRSSVSSEKKSSKKKKKKKSSSSRHLNSDEDDGGGSTDDHHEKKKKKKKKSSKDKHHNNNNDSQNDWESAATGDKSINDDMRSEAESFNDDW